MDDFYLGIGAPRCGTTWLYANLRNASDVYLPPVKELRYFSGFRSDEEKADQIARDRAKPMQDPRDPAFYDTWTTTPDNSAAHYLDLFPQTGKVGEISPIYCTLQRQRVIQIRRILADRRLRVFFLMRNPYDRDLSHIIFTMHRNRQRHDPYTTEEYLAFVDRPRFVSRSDYRATVITWQEVLRGPIEKFYYDDLKADPVRFFTDFCDRMGVTGDADKISPGSNNSSGSQKKFAVTLPDAVHRHLIARHRDSVAQMKFLPDAQRDVWLAQIAEAAAQYGAD